MVSPTTLSSLAFAASRSRSDQIVRFLAEASNSLHRCQISGGALVSQRASGKQVCSDVIASTSALTAMPSMLPP
jgi:hypothetical protein